MQNEHLLKFKNSVILKDEFGKTKQTVYDLPPTSHAYGKAIVDDPEPIKYVVNGWKQAVESSDSPSKLKDFSTLNKLAVINHALTAKQQKEFRSTQDVMQQKKVGQKVMPIMLPEEDFIYGVPNRPSTPVKLVIGNCFAIEQAKKKEEKYRLELEQTNLSSKGIASKTTKSQQLRQAKAENQRKYQQKPNIDTHFKLSKYTSMTTVKVDTGLGRK